MPRSFGGGGKRNAATLLGLSKLNKNLERIPVTDPNSCQILLEVYEECMISSTSNGAGRCDEVCKMMESCREFKRVPGIQKMAERQKKLEDSYQRKVTAAGFASIGEYINHEIETDPSLCRTAYKMYNECLASSPDETKEYCEFFRNNCPQFK